MYISVGRTEPVAGRCLPTHIVGTPQDPDLAAFNYQW
jgi:hypothetical protein